MAPSRILVTGANGFIGAHILRQLLPRPGVSIRAVVRSPAKVAALQRDFAGFANLDFAVVPDITAPGAFEAALAETEVPFQAVIHTASPFVFKGMSDNRRFLDPAVQGTRGILETIQRVAPRVERVVVTSSFAAVADFVHLTDKMPGKHHTEEDWNPILWEEALNGDATAGYLGSKTFAERAAWQFIKDEQPHFDLVTICPPMVYGPLAHTITRLDDLNESNARLYHLYFTSSQAAPVPDDWLYLAVDPREVATAHIEAVFRPDAGNQRFIVCAGQLPNQTIADVLRAAFPELAERTPVGVPGTNSVEGPMFSASRERSERVLGVRYRGVEESLVDLGRQVLEIERRGGGGLKRRKGGGIDRQGGRSGGCSGGCLLSYLGQLESVIDDEANIKMDMSSGLEGSSHGMHVHRTGDICS